MVVNQRGGGLAREEGSVERRRVGEMRRRVFKLKPLVPQPNPI